MAIVKNELTLIKRTLTKEFEESTLFEFIPLKNSGDAMEKEIRIGSFIYIQFSKNKKLLDVKVVHKETVKGVAFGESLTQSGKKSSLIQSREK